jgi:hypothetical protein
LRGLLRAGLALLLISLLAGTAAAATIRGSARADRLMTAFGGASTVRCGAGRDLVVADRLDKVSGDCEVVARRLSVDTFKDPASQHETAVEPDSFAWGSTVVATFQVARFRSGAADGIGFATSKNAGRTWTTGTLPGLTVQTNPPGEWARASDPSVAYDAAHGVWLAATLVLGAGNDRSGMAVSRARDGVHWTAPVTAATGPGLDKEWIACDNGADSPFRGRCYLVYTDDALHRISLQTSDDAGVTWSAAARVAGELIGAYPVVQPDGSVTVLAADVPDNSRGTILGLRSTDGGATFAPPQRVSDVQWRPAQRMRAIPLPSAAVDAAGTIYVAWHDCRFRSGCAVNDVVVASSRDARTWTAPVRVAVDGIGSGVDHFITGLDADPTSQGKLGVVYAFFAPGSCTNLACRLEIGFSSSTDGGTTWAPQQRLDAASMSLDWLPPTTGGLMVGDYFSTSFANGHAVPVFAAAAAPLRGRFREGIFAASLPVESVR